MIPWKQSEQKIQKKNWHYDDKGKTGQNEKM